MWVEAESRLREMDGSGIFLPLGNVTIGGLVQTVNCAEHFLRCSQMEQNWLMTTFNDVIAISKAL